MQDVAFKVLGFGKAALPILHVGVVGCKQAGRGIWLPEDGYNDHHPQQPTKPQPAKSAQSRETLPYTVQTSNQKCIS